MPSCFTQSIWELSGTILMSLQYLHVVELIFGACFNPVHGVQVPFVPAVPFGQLEHFILPSMNVVIPGEHLSHLDWPA